MRRNLIVSILVIVFFLACVTSMYAEKRVAFILGNSEYNSDGNKSLSQPINNAEAFDKALKSFGFETILLKNGDKKETLDSLYNFISILNEDDVAVFYYSGYGISINGLEYIVPTKTEFRNNVLESKLVGLATIMKEMQKRSKLSLIFYDACRNEPNAQIMVTSRTKGESINDTYSNNQLMICYATSQEKTATTGNGSKLSPFTEVIIDNIYKQEDFETLWYNSIRNDNRLSNQVPQNSGGIAGEFYFNKPVLSSQDNVIKKPAEVNVKTYNDDELFPKNLEKNLENKWGFINKNGDFVIPPNYNYAYHFSEGLARVLGPNDKWGYIDTSDNLIIQFKYSLGSDFSNGFATVKNDAYLEGCIDKTGKEFLPLIYKDVNIASNGMIIVENKYGKYGILDYNGIQKVPFIYNYISDESEGLCAVEQGDKWGCINKEGNVVIDFLYDYVGPFSEGLCAVKKGGKWGYIDKNGKVVIDFLYDFPKGFLDGYAIVKQGEKWGVINKLGKFIVECMYDGIDRLGPNCLIINQNGMYGMMSLNGDIMITPSCYDYIYSEGIYITTQTSREYVHYEMGMLKKGDKWGIMDKFGNIISQCIYDAIDHFSEGLCAVKKGDKWGYIDEEGNVVIDFLYDNAQSFFRGLAKVDVGAPHYKYINRKGEIVR